MRAGPTEDAGDSHDFDLDLSDAPAPTTVDETTADDAAEASVPQRATPDPETAGYLSFCALTDDFADRVRKIATSGGSAAEQVTELKGLIQYSEKVFDLEEQLMRRTGFPGQTSHIEDHGRFRAVLDKLVAHLSAPNAMADWGLADVLEKWANRHLSRYDGPLERYIKVVAAVRIGSKGNSGAASA